MSRSFRDLLSIRVALLSMIGMAICAAVMILLLRWSLDRELNGSILNVAAIQAAALTDAATGEMHFHEWDLTPDEAASIRELVRFAQVWSGTGASLLRSQYMTGDLPRSPESLQAAADGQLVWEEAVFEGVPIRSVHYPLARLGEAHSGHVLQIAAPLLSRNTMLRRGAIFGIGLVLLTGLASVVGGRWLADRMVLPVAEIIDEAESVGRGTHRHRIHAHGETREYERLVHVLNGMLDRLDATFEAQRRFTADASHELRSPLTAMRGELELALRRERPPAEYREVLASAREEVVRLSGVVEGLLTLARADAGAIQPRLRRGDLGAVLRVAVERSAAMTEGAAVDVVFRAAGPVTAEFDPDLMAQLASNLTQNAIRFAGPGGRVQVSLRSNGKGAELTVEDSGPGIPLGDEGEVFQRFWRADPSRTHGEGSSGVGLGLSIAKAIAEAHGGTIAASNGGSLGGARLEVRLPLG